MVFFWGGGFCLFGLDFFLFFFLCYLFGGFVFVCLLFLKENILGQYEPSGNEPVKIAVEE